MRTNGLAPLPGTAEWVERLFQEGWPQAIASSAPRLNVEAVLDALHLRKWFQATVSAEDVQAGKLDKLRVKVRARGAEYAVFIRSTNQND